MRDEGSTSVETPPRRKVRFAHGWVGVGLIVVAWPLNWLLTGPRTHLLFFPLWLGYVLVVDALVLRRTGRSMVTAEPRPFAALFLVSIPLWWVFELLNKRTRNWQYVGAELFSDFEYVLLASLAFSTVIPAILETSELVSTFRWMRKASDGPRLPAESSFEFVLFAAGAGMLGLVVARPDAFYPFLWGALYAIVEPVNVWLGRPTLLSRLHRGNWQPLVALSVGALICGFFWEMWNYFSYPKWVYRTPGVEFLHVFEMPLLGYVGYLPFAWEVYAFVHLIMRTPPCLELDAGHGTV